MTGHRALAPQTDDQIVALFSNFFARQVDIGRVVFDVRQLAAIERSYADPATRLIERGQRNGLGVLALGNATSLDKRTGTLIGLDLGPVRIWTFVHERG